MISYFLKTVKENYNLKKRPISEYSRIHKNFMDFCIDSYTISEIGNLSTVKMSGLFGMMKMETVILTPLYKDAPLFSYDLIQVMGKDTLLLELYDTQIKAVDCKELEKVKAQYQKLSDHDLGTHWYDHLKLSASLSKRGKKMVSVYKNLCRDYFQAYLKLLANCDFCDQKKKQALVKSYVDGLLNQGGPSTDQFKKMIGENATRELFSKYIFASE